MIQTGSPKLTVENWKNVAWSDESQFLLRHLDGRVRIWDKQHESTAYLRIVAG